MLKIIDENDVLHKFFYDTMHDLKWVKLKLCWLLKSKYGLDKIIIGALQTILKYKHCLDPVKINVLKSRWHG